ncbi:MAG: hypothetical protein Rhims3KO_06590 [Hyphomicrobiales bacterium]
MVTDALSAGDVNAMSTAALESAKDVRFTGFPFFMCGLHFFVDGSFAAAHPFAPIKKPIDRTTKETTCRGA